MLWSFTQDELTVRSAGDIASPHPHFMLDLIPIDLTERAASTCIKIAVLGHLTEVTQGSRTIMVLVSVATRQSACQEYQVYRQQVMSNAPEQRSKDALFVHDGWSIWGLRCHVA